jgi:methyl-accepting chemotaxis protein
MAKGYKRNLSNYLINKHLQLHLIIHNLIYMLVIVIVTVSIVLYPLIRDMVFSNDFESQYQAAQTFLMLVKWLVPAILILLVLFTAHIILTTHRICGPLVNFTNTFDRLAHGDLSQKVYLRKGDYLKSECERINLMIEGISGIITRLFDDYKKLMSTLQILNEQIKDLDTKEKIVSSLEIIKQDVKYVSDTLSSFKMENDKSKK